MVASGSSKYVSSRARRDAAGKRRKDRLNVRVDADLLSSAKERAKEQGVTLTSLVVDKLQEFVGDDQSDLF